MTTLGFVPVSLKGLYVVNRVRRADERGSLTRIYCRDELAEIGLTDTIAQVNHTVTRRRGTVRGMHFQTGAWAEDKLVTCLRGRIFDVAVDVRRGSPTLGRWHAEELSADNARGLLIPKGFAHGFQTLEDDCELLYLHSRPYNPAAEGGLRPMDPELAIAWPLEVTGVSARDLAHPAITLEFGGIDY